MADDPTAPPADLTHDTAPLQSDLEPLPLPDDRPAQNVLAEMQRKYTKIERQNEELLSTLHAFQSQHQAQQAAVQAPGGDYNDEQLGQLAAAGNGEAIRVLVERQTARATQGQMQQMTQVAAVQQALQRLFEAYPMLQHDPQHPLTQTVQQIRQHFVQSGWAPGLLTDLEAIKSAVTSYAHRVINSHPAETTRRAGIAAQQSMSGVASRRSPQAPSAAGGATLDRRVAGIAARMNVKDPQHWQQRFEKRQADGRSTVSPAVLQAIREDQA